MKLTFLIGRVNVSDLEGSSLASVFGVEINDSARATVLKFTIDRPGETKVKAIMISPFLSIPAGHEFHVSCSPLEAHNCIFHRRQLLLLDLVQASTSSILRPQPLACREIALHFSGPKMKGRSLCQTEEWDGYCIDGWTFAYVQEAGERDRARSAINL